jgi:phosphoglucosamine mutase
MAEKLFGTDGIRAVAGEFPLDPASLRTLGEALVRLLREKGLAPRVLVGRDTRESGPWMEEALVQGMAGIGGSPVSAGVIPTSAVSHLARTHGFSAGIVISASHNPYRDNGIKVFSGEGFKIAPDWEDFLETAILGGPPPQEAGAVEVLPDVSLLEDYADFLKSRLNIEKRDKRIRVVVDCSNGAGSRIAPRVLGELGVDVTAIHAAPDGTNINLGCGSLHPEKLAEEVLRTGADVGIAYDGDADRALWVDETGRVLNGDHTLYVQAFHMKTDGRLRTNEVVATTMSNMGLERAFEKAGIALVRTKVGDKYVLEEMIKRGANLGGEQSGHTIFLDDCPTGDGILTSLKMLEALAADGRPFSEIARGLEEYPQTLVNVPVTRKPDFSEFPEIVRALESVRTRLGGDGRFDLRYSGTEPLARVMVEAKSLSLVDSCAREVADAVRKCLGTERL